MIAPVTWRYGLEAIARSIRPGSLLRYDAIVRTALGEKDEAFRLLQEYARANPDALADNDDPWFEDLWSDPRWQALKSVKR